MMMMMMMMMMTKMVMVMVTMITMVMMMMALMVVIMTIIMMMMMMMMMVKLMIMATMLARLLLTCFISSDIMLFGSPTTGLKMAPSAMKRARRALSVESRHMGQRNTPLDTCVCCPCSS